MMAIQSTNWKDYYEYFAPIRKDLSHLFSHNMLPCPPPNETGTLLPLFLPPSWRSSCFSLCPPSTCLTSLGKAGRSSLAPPVFFLAFVPHGARDSSYHEF
jgi:hypothetical protein